MKISFILSSLRLSGGVKVVVEYSNRLARQGHTIYLVTPGGTVDLTHLPPLTGGVTVIESKVARRTRPSLPDHLRLSWSLGRAVPASDVVISTHTPTTVPAWLAAKYWRSRLFWLHQDYALMFAGRSIELFLYKHAARWHHHILAISTSIYEALHKQGFTHVSFVGEGLGNLKLFQARQKTSYRSPSHQTVMYLGDSRPRKGLEDFLQAMNLVYQRLDNIRLLLVSKEQLTVNTALPFEFVHSPPVEVLADCYAGSNLFVYPSWEEGFGLPPLEAMACGTPVVLTDSGGVREYAQHEDNCLLVPPRQPELLATAIERVLTDGKLAGQLQRNGPPTAAQFTWEAAVERFEAILEL